MIKIAITTSDIREMKRGGADERSEAASRADARSVPDGNHGDNIFPTRCSVCEGQL